MIIAGDDKSHIFKNEKLMGIIIKTSSEFYYAVEK
jgi:hypothetical protein